MFSLEIIYVEMLQHLCVIAIGVVYAYEMIGIHF
jgi:hypothetical protein